MSNHSDDCPDCAQDRRDGPCCAAERARIAAEASAHEFEQFERRQLFNRLGIAHCQSPDGAGRWITLPQTESLLAFLRSLPPHLRRAP